MISGHVEAYPWDDLVRYADFHARLERHVLAGQAAGKTPEQVTGEFTLPDSLNDFAFSEPFATNFVRLMYAEASAQ